MARDASRVGESAAKDVHAVSRPIAVSMGAKQCPHTSLSSGQSRGNLASIAGPMLSDYSLQRCLIPDLS